MSVPMTEVEWSVGATVNTGNFNNIKVEFRVKDHVRKTDENIDAASERVYAFVEQKLAEKIDALKMELSSIQKDAR